MKARIAQPGQPGGVPKSTAQAGKELEIVQRQEEAARLRLRGKSVREIAQILGISSTQAQRDIMTIVAQSKEVAESCVIVERAMSLGRLDAMLESVMDLAVSGDSQAIASVLKMDERRAKLLGLDAPAKQEISAGDGLQVALAKVGDALARKRAREAG
jgi:hypothetical protein